MGELRIYRIIKLFSILMVIFVVLTSVFTLWYVINSDVCCSCSIMGFEIDTKNGCFIYEDVYGDGVLESVPNAFLMLLIRHYSLFDGGCALIEIQGDFLEYDSAPKKIVFEIRNEDMFLFNKPFPKYEEYKSISYLNWNPWVIDFVYLENQGRMPVCGKEVDGEAIVITGASSTEVNPKKGFFLLFLFMILWIISNRKLKLIKRRINRTNPPKHDLNSEESWWGSAAREKDEQQNDSGAKQSSD